MDWFQLIKTVFEDPTVSKTVSKNFSKVATPETIKLATKIGKGIAVGAGAIGAIGGGILVKEYITTRREAKKQLEEQAKKKLEESIGKKLENRDFESLNIGLLQEENNKIIGFMEYENNRVPLIEYKNIEPELAKELNEKGIIML